MSYISFHRKMKKIFTLSSIFGFNPSKFVESISNTPFYFRDLQKIKAQYDLSGKEFPFGKPYPCLSDRYDSSGTAQGHYFHQDLLVARKVFSNNPYVHLDVGSRVDGFISHVASYRLVKVIDIRSLSNTITNIEFIQADMMGSLPVSLYNSCDSLSCLHALEHFGLGRYGDPVKYNGYLLGLENLYNLLSPQGKFYFSVPIGPQRLEFNAHRVFSILYIIELFKNKYRIDSFSYVDDKGDLHENVEFSSDDIANNYGCHYGCGIFEMTKF